MDIHRVANEIFMLITQLSGLPAYGTIVGILFLCGCGFPLPEDIILLAAGFLAAQGKIEFFFAVVCCFVGVVGGDFVLFSTGRHFGRRVFNLPILRSIFTPELVAKAESKVRSHGRFVCFFARFLPGLRAPVFAISGALGIRRTTFFLLDGAAAMISVPFWVCVGYKVTQWFSDDINQIFHEARKFETVLLIVGACILGLYLARKFHVMRKLEKAGAK